MFHIPHTQWCDVEQTAVELWGNGSDAFSVVLVCHTEASTVTVQYVFLLEFVHASVQWMSVGTAPLLYSTSPLSGDAGRTVFMHVTHKKAPIFTQYCFLYTNHIQGLHKYSI